MRWCPIIAVLLMVSLLAGCAGPAPTATTPPALPTPSASLSAPEEALEAVRKAMVENQIRARGVADEKVLRAMEKVPRHRFVPEEHRHEAYADRPLPIGLGQTISQPYIVALMTELLALQPGDKVLEIGTGSGYQAAVLAELTDQVYTVEIIEVLAQRAGRTLRDLGYHQVETRAADGYYGWEEQAPYDAIIVTCASDHVPQPLVGQLKDGGRMVIPVGPPGAYQTLWLIRKEGGEVRSFNQGPVLFVPMTGER